MKLQVPFTFCHPTAQSRTYKLGTLMQKTTVLIISVPGRATFTYMKQVTLFKNYLNNIQEFTVIIDYW